MYKNFILEFIRAKGQEGNGSAERLHEKVGDRMLLPPCLFPVIYHWVSPPSHEPSTGTSGSPKEQCLTNKAGGVGHPS